MRKGILFSLKEFYAKAYFPRFMGGINSAEDLKELNNYKKVKLINSV